MKNILITGGAGYLGLNVSLSLLEKNVNIVIVDDLKNSYKEHVSSLVNHFPTQVNFYEGNVCDYEFMKSVFEKYSFETVVHLAAHKYVGESIKYPEEYKSNNINSLTNILNLCDEFKVSRLAFASSAVIYGNTSDVPVVEETVLSPLSPYAETKAEGEKIIQDWHKKTKIPATIFRFSNPAGANTKFMFGDHSKKGFENLIPYIVKSAINNTQMTFKGNDHPTPDGTPIRDYIHISDLANIVSTVLLTSANPGVEILNISRGTGFSLLEIVKTIELKLNKNLNYNFEERNKNESSISLLDQTKLNQTYFVSHKFGLNEIIDSQIEFYKKLKHTSFKD